MKVHPFILSNLQLLHPQIKLCILKSLIEAAVTVQTGIQHISLEKMNTTHAFE